ncbi:hypothetical protein ACH5RR_010836 [Cinchona calisaya]|uniref:GATA-type domain-containing protein n=1 Tax=Cinchona calisaya TaxID=153742 RepID=A0ABD3AK85_9GENT
MDLKEEKRSESENTKAIRSSTPSDSAAVAKQIKCCSDCQTTRTPLWRGGPAGPKSLCNACGIKYHKKRRELLGVDGAKKKRKTNNKSTSSGGGSSGGRQSVKLMKLMALGGEMMLRRSGKLLGKLREEEQAAILLMALSCGSSSVYA